MQAAGGRGDCGCQSLSSTSNTGGQTAVKSNAESYEVLEQ